MKVRDIIARYEAFCPPQLSMEGDVCGLQLGSLDQEVTKVMVCLDVREQTVAEAIEQGADLLIVKHAPIFRPLKDLVSSPQRDILLQLVKHDIAVYVSHTNIDVVSGGLNDWFCDLLGIEETEVLSETKEGQGIGRIGRITQQSLSDFARKVKAVFDLDSVRLVTYGDGSELVSRVAICGGSGESFYPAALEKGAKVYITGDIYYHTAQDMLTQGLSAIDPGHHIEVLFVERLTSLLQTWQVAENWPVTIIPSQRSTNPFRHL